MKQNRIIILFSLFFIFVLFNFLTQEIKITSINQEKDLDSSDSWVLSRVFIDDSDPDHNWSKTASENDWCYGSGTIENPYIIENVTINYQTVDFGGLIDIRNSNVYFIIRDCTLYKTDVFGRSINLENTNYGRITDNYCSNENGYGIKLKNSNYNLIYNNLLSYNIHSGISIESSHDNEIFNNSFTENNFGIELFSCGYNNVSSNEFRRNGRGIYLDGASYCNISKNAFIRDYGGIDSYGSINCIFNDNVINLSSYEGIFLDSGCTDNLFYGNQLNNKKNAVDNGQKNLWNCSLYGNFWSDYTGRDANDDGIGDSPYIIPGSANGIDYLPIWDDNIEAPPYFYDQPEDISMVQGNELMNITWQADDINNNYDSFWILKDGIMIENNSWDGSPITYLDLYLLEPGIYNFTCFVNDTDNFKVSDTVFVTINPDIYPPEINIILPYLFQLCGNKSIDFQLSIAEPNLNST